MDDKKKTVTEEETKGTASKETDEILDFDEMRESKKSESDNKKGSDKGEGKDEKDTKKEDIGKDERKESDKKESKNSEKDKKKDSEKGKNKNSKKTEKKESEKEDGKDSEKAEKESEKEASKDSEEDKKEPEKEVNKDSEKAEKKESEQEKSKDSEKDKKESEKKDSKDSEKDKKESKAVEKEASKDSKKAEEKEPEKDSKKDSEENKKEDSAKDVKKDLEQEDNKDSKTADQGDKSDFLEQEVITTKNTKSNKGKKALAIALGVVAVLLLIVYISGFVYFSGHFYQDVAINGVTVSNMDKAEAKQVLDKFYTNYILTMETIDGNQLSVDGKDIAMQITLRDEFDSCMQKQQAYLWFVNMMGHHDYEIGADASWDEDALSAVYDSMDILNKKMMTAPKDAYVGVEDGKFAIVKEIMGTTINASAFKQAVGTSLKSVQSVLNLMDAGCYTLPTVYESDKALQEEYEAKSTFSGNEVKIQMDDLTLEPGMELYEEVLEKKGDSYEVSKNLVKKYVEGLAKEYDTLDTERTFTTSFSSKKATVYGSAFGYKLNQDETTNALYKALTAGKPSTVEAVFDSKGYTLQGENDIGNTYVEVNLSEQRVIAYKNGRKIAEGDCVSGKESIGHGTTIGLYAIQDKLSPTVLRGEKRTVTKTVTQKNKKGKKVEKTVTTTEYEYESPVTFWLQFNGGIGLHDAAGWRNQYGGSIYYYSGSHGCVNLPYDLAETIYNNFEVGDPVIVYFWDNENRK